MLMARLQHVASDPELQVGILAVIALSGYGAWSFIRWLARGSTTPDPWDESITAEISNDEATPLCHHCLAPHEASADFCPDCGAPVGSYTNWLPYPYLFSIGYALRTGTSGNFKRSPLTIVGFILFSLVEYSLLAPIYWFIFLRCLFRPDQSDPPSEQHPSEPAPESE